MKKFHKFKTGEIEPTKELNVDDTDNLEDVNNLKLNVFELNEDKTLTQYYASKNMIKNIHQGVNEEIHMEIYVETPAQNN